MEKEIQNIVKEAENLGLKSELLEWVKDFKQADPSLNEKELYKLSLSAITDTSDNKGMIFNRGTVNIEMPLPYKKESNIMIGLAQDLSDRQLKNPSSLNPKTYSQIGQDIFINNLFKEKRNGLFIDVGADPPKYINNTIY